MTRRDRQPICTDYSPDCDDYDPRKPEYVKAATDCEVAQAELELFARQARSLECAIARRDKLEPLSWFFSRKRAHYKQVIGEMKEELQQDESVWPVPSAGAERCWRPKPEWLSCFFVRKRAHYKQFIAEIRAKLKRNQSAWPVPSNNAARRWRPWDTVIPALFRWLGLCLPGCNFASICGLLDVRRSAFVLPSCHVHDVDAGNQPLLLRETAFFATGSTELLQSATTFALLLMPRVMKYPY